MIIEHKLNNGFLAEWSNATDLSSVLFGGAGSNPAGAIFRISYSKFLAFIKKWVSGSSPELG